MGSRTLIYSMSLYRISKYVEVIGKSKKEEEEEEEEERNLIKLSIMHETHTHTHTQMIITQCDSKDNKYIYIN
jgi:hypothetical protein